MPRIIFRIDQDGNVTEEVQGVTNDTCIDITKEIEDTLGNVKSRELKPEAGKMMIFPALWPWMHRGYPPKTETKYIVTGWLKC